jgi:hypothetical protein
MCVCAVSACVYAHVPKCECLSDTFTLVVHTRKPVTIVILALNKPATKKCKIIFAKLVSWILISYQHTLRSNQQLKSLLTALLFLL